MEISGATKKIPHNVIIKTSGTKVIIQSILVEFLILETYDLVNVLSDMRIELKESNFIYITKSDETRAYGIDIRIESRC